MAEIKKYLDTTALSALVDQIKAEDAKVKAYVDKHIEDAGTTYDVAGAAATAESNAKAYTDILANGAVKTNTEAIAKLNGDANTDGSVAKAVADAKTVIDADVDAVEAVANQNKADIAAINNAETGVLAQAKGYTDTEVAKVQGEVDALEQVVQNIQENAYDDTEIRGLITDLEAGKADKTQVASDIAAAVNAETDARVEAVAAVQTAADNAKAAADKAQEEVDALEQTHATDKAALEAKDAELQSAIDAEVERAGDAEAALEGRIETMEAFWEAAQADGTDSNVIDTLKEIQEYIASDESGASAMAASIKKNTDDIAAMDIAYKAADTTLQGNIDALAEVVNSKAAASDVEALEGRVDGINEAVATLQSDDVAQVERIAALEAKFGEGEGSVEDMVADAKQEAIDSAVAAAATDAANKDAVVLAESQKYTDGKITDVETAVTAAQEDADKGIADAAAALRAAQDAAAQATSLNDAMAERMAAVEAAKHTHANQAELDLIATGDKSKWDAAADKAHEHSNKTVLDGVTADKVALWDTVSAKAAQTDLDAAVESIAANTSKINSFTAITADEVNAMFA